MPVSHKFHDSILIFNILGSTFTKKYGRNSTLTCLKSNFTYKETDSSGNTESKDTAIALWLNAILLIKKTFYLKSFLKIIYAIKNNLSKQLKGITFPQPPAPSPAPRSHLLFYCSWVKLLFHGPHVSKLLLHGPALSKLLFHGPVDRKHLFYFCIVKVSNFSVEGSKTCN